NFECAGYTFYSKFDSGNLGRVELVRCCEGKQMSSKVFFFNFPDVEFNLWTRPDCAGTPYENQNRTWFYFAVTGGRPNQIVKFNVMNLNKQAKLFSQGMHPVTKVGPGGRWERIKDKPSYSIANDVFFISFLHRAPESAETKTYYAFTFPFTYNELLEQLGNFDKRYGPTNLDPRDDIYYYRELLTHSVEKRRIELLTITSFHGIQNTREERLRNLFPEDKTPRCHTFKNKKVVFISSRVHPGETPASFVLNGFLSTLLDRKSVVSITLRRMYVFKIIPFLNPDGVYNGLYRSDTRGHNLNRVYLTPNVETQPSIYAARKLIRYANELRIVLEHCVSETMKKSALGSLGVKKANVLHHKRGEGKIRPQTPQMYSHFRSHRNEYLNPASQKNLNISLDYLAQLDEKNDKVIYEERSNMFLYIDLHGHASKKGVFMYGNHLPSTIEAVECMLLPRLMSMNSQHFHYDACNFSERNMYYKGKRDGLSKEGSGRVAIYKCTGLIKSYTLECNYNTGKSVNILPPRGKEPVTAKVQSPVPPKYTPAVFEEVGRALGPSILDLTNSNPQTRIHNSEFRTLQGMRNTLRIEIERGSSKARVTNKVPKPHSKRLSNQSSSSLEIAKENALQWENIGVPSSGSISGTGGGTGSPPGAGAVGGNGNGNGKGTGDPLGGNASGCCSATSSGGRQFLKGSSLKGHSGKISRKTSSAGGKGFGKKDVVKKSKILCESGVAGAVVTSGKKLQELMRNKDQHQVPRKKIKVSPPHQHASVVDGFDLCFKSNLAATSLPNFLAAPPSLGDLPLSKKVKSESKLLEECLDCDDSLDAIPCCSYTLPTTTSGGAVALTKLISTYSQAAAGSPGVASGEGITPISSSSIAINSGSGSSSGGEKDTGKAGKISKFSKATSAKQQAKLGKCSKSNDGGKLLKKKRSLKTDSNLKRKKTRVKPALT
ncbi:AAEL001406-PA, partial [Aedes aegypti]